MLIGKEIVKEEYNGYSSATWGIDANGIYYLGKVKRFTQALQRGISWLLGNVRGITRF